MSYFILETLNPKCLGFSLRLLDQPPKPSKKRSSSSKPHQTDPERVGKHEKITLTLVLKGKKTQKTKTNNVGPSGKKHK